MEVTDTSAVEALMWFFGGIFSYRIMTRILNYGYMVNTFAEILVSILLMLRMSDEYMQRGNEYLHAAALESGKDKEEIIKEKEANEIALELCRNLAIANVVSSTPKHYRGLLKFNSWEQAMRLLKDKGGYNVFGRQEED